MDKKMILQKGSKVAIVAVFLGICSWYFFTRIVSLQGNPIVVVRAGEGKIYAERVRSQEKMQRGLGGRKNLCKNCGMLFEFPERSRKAFWMKEMLVALDIIWIDQGKVVHVEEKVSADDKRILNPECLADKVLELPAGVAEKIGIREGVEVQLGG
ncbi:MAG TPA: DUF192 domain-containing protein [Candidatus Moranbacteria bacterium]|nr:DUF192 domain-containing protein [Candidatus Moranbacteria bacterium]